MDDKALFDLATATALNALDRAEHLLDRALQSAEPEALLETALVPHSFDCAHQLRTVTIFALRLVLTPIGKGWSLSVSGCSPDVLRRQFDGARADIRALKMDDYAGASSRLVEHTAGEAKLSQKVEDYIQHFAIPNLWFHLSMAYAIMRQSGVEIGKADFDGLHQYETGFSFV